MSKEDYEIDPNSSFNKLKKLQIILKEDSAIQEQFQNERDEMIKRMEEITHNYYIQKIKLYEIYNNQKIIQDQENEEKTLQEYLVFEKGAKELPQSYDLLTKLLFIFRNDYKKLLTLLKVLKKESFEEISDFLCHFLYEDIFDTNNDNPYFLKLVYFLLDKEIEELNINNINSFLNPSTSFCAKLFISLTRRNDVQLYLKNLLGELIIEMKGLNYNNDQEDISIWNFLSLDPLKIKQFIKNNANFKCKKKIENYEKFLLRKLKPCNIFLLVNKLTKNNELLKDCSMAYNDNYIDNIEKSIFGINVEKNEENNNFENDDNCTSLYKYLDHYLNNNSKNNDDNEQGIDIINNVLSKTNLENIISNEKSQEMIEYYKLQLKSIGNDDDTYTINKFISELPKENNDLTIVIYLNCVERIKKYLDKIFSFIMYKTDSMPSIIKQISHIIDRLIIKKFKDISLLKRYICFTNFFFGTLILPILLTPWYNGIVVQNYSDYNYLDENLQTLITVLEKLLKYRYFSNDIPKESLYTIFNNYFSQLIPCIHSIFDATINIELPSIIKELLNKKEKDIQLNDEDYLYNFSDENSEKDFEYQSLCISLDNLLLLYATMKENEKIIFPKGNDNSSYFKIFNKLLFQENGIINKKKEYENKDIKPFITFQQINYNKDLYSKLFPKKQKITFENKNTDLKLREEEIVTLNKIKYSISVIIKHLNPLTRANFMLNDNTESTESFIKGLNKMLELEGFSEMLKVDTIPLEWFAIYLQTNISRIPQNYKRQNYSELYQELIDENEELLKERKKINIIPYMNQKLKVGSLKSKFLENIITNLQNIQMNFDCLHFIISTNIKVSLKITYDKNTFTCLQIEDSTKIINPSSKKTPKNTYLISCENINELLNKFPFLNKELQDTNVLPMEVDSKIPQSLEKYFKLIFEYLQKDDNFKSYNSNELNELQIKLVNYIHKKLYNKLFPDMPSEDDIIIYQKSFLHRWVEISHFDKKFINFDDSLLDVAISAIKMMDEANCPFDKLKCFAKANEILQNILILEEGMVDDNLLDKLFLYAVIKANLSTFDTDITYIDIYINDEQKSGIIIFLIQKMKNISEIIRNINHNNFVDMTEECYNSLIEKEISNK